MGFRDKLKNVFKSDDAKNNVQTLKVDSVKTDLTSGDVLFVCMSNDFVSPIAEAIFNLFSEDYNAFSAGIVVKEGEMAANNAIIISALNQIDLSGHITTNIDEFSLGNVGLVLTSTASIRDALKLKYPDVSIFTIMEYSGEFSDIDIEEPMIENYGECENSFRRIFDAVLKIVNFDDIFNQSIFDDKAVDNFHFANLDYLIHSGEKIIVLSSDVILSDGEVQNYSDGIKLDVDDLIIDGAGHTIDAGGKVRIFNCSARNVVIKNITLKNGYFKHEGGALLNTGEMTILEARFDDNEAGWDGGTIKNSGTLIVVDSKFRGNSASRGGAIFNDDGLTLERCKFNDNNARIEGGALYNWIGAVIDDCTFEGNVSDKGGAIYNVRQLSIVKSIFSQNKAHSTGGGFYSSGDMTIDDSIVDGNVADGCGGGIYNYNNADLVITDSTIKNNSSGGHGGAIGNHVANLQVVKCCISDNSSAGDIIHNTDYIQIFNTDFRANTSQHLLTNCDKNAIVGIFDGEFCDNDVFESLILNRGKFCIVEKAIFDNNLLADGSLNIINHSDMTLAAIEITDDGKTVSNEGKIFLKNTPYSFISKIFGNGNVESNMHPGGEHPNFEYLAEKIRIDHDYEDKWIKVSFDGKTKQITLKTDFTLAAYEYEFYEGGIELDMDDIVIDGGGRTIDASGRSRVFIVIARNVTIKNVTFKNGHSYIHHDSSNNNGGAIRIAHGGELTVINCRFTDNQSEGTGGAIFNRNGSLHISKAEFNCNISGNSGGAISHKGDLTIEESILSDNVSERSGGAISCVGVSYIDECTLSQNTAYSGGAIITSGMMTVSNSILQKNRADYYYGGAIDNSGKLIVKDSQVIGNTAERDGGAIHNNNAELTLLRTAFSGNPAKEKGDAVFNYREISFKVENCDLEFWDVTYYNEYDGGD